MNIEIRQKDERTSWEELTKLFHESFQERLDQGMQFTCSSFTPKIMERLGENNVILVATDKDDGCLAGEAMIGIEKNKKGGTWGYLSNMAISPAYKRCGIGSKLEEGRINIAKANGCRYVISDTAVGATSSVNWHLKNGFKFFELESFYSTNYYSYIFRKQLVHHPLWSNSVYCKLHYWKSAILCRLKLKANGEPSDFLNFYVRIRKILHI